MDWKVDRIHGLRYPDEGWTMEKCIRDYEEHACRSMPYENAPSGSPEADVDSSEFWRVWHFRYSRPSEGPFQGSLPQGPVIDFHAHAWVDSFAPRLRAYFRNGFGATAFDPGTLAGVSERKRRLGITKSVILPVPTNPRQVSLFNGWLKNHLGDEDVVPFMGVHPDMEDPAAEIHRCAALGFKGLKLHPINQEFRMADRRMSPIYEAAIEEGMVLLFHTGSGIDHVAKGLTWDCTELEVERFFERYPYEKTVLAHFGGSFNMTYTPHVHPEWPGYLDTAFQLGHIPDDEVLHIVREFGANRVLFGTDSPWEDASAFLVRMAHMGFSEDELHAILYDNGARLLGLPLRD